MSFFKPASYLLAVILFGLVLLVPFVQADINTSESRPFESSVDGGPGKLGLGLMLGEPSGITGKYWLSRTNAVDLGMAYSFNNYFAIMSDYLFHFPNAFSPTAKGDLKGQFVPFIGFGAILFVNSAASNSFPQNSNQHFFTDSNGNSAALGLRVPLGVEFLARKAPLGVYVEVDPGVGIIPDTFGFVEAEIGARFYF